MYKLSKKPRFNRSEMHGDLPFKKGTVVSASKIKRWKKMKKKVRAKIVDEVDIYDGRGNFISAQNNRRDYNG